MTNCYSKFSSTAVCSVPQPPISGVVTNVNGEVLNGELLAGAVVEYHCDEGLLPEGNFIAECVDTENGGQWIPNPSNSLCQVPGIVLITMHAVFT